jgi:hypothetical protein
LGGDDAVDTEDLKSIDRKLGVLISLIAYQIAEGKTVAEGAPVLKRLGLSSSEIADVFDSTAKAVSVRIAEAKKKAHPR